MKILIRVAQTIKSTGDTFKGLITCIKDVFDNPQTLDDARFDPRSFTRPQAAKLPFPLILRMMLNNSHKCGPNYIRDFFSKDLICEMSDLEKQEHNDLLQQGKIDDQPPSQQAWSKDRQKFDYTPFKKASDECIKYLYSEKKRTCLATLNDMYTFGIDGCETPLPNFPNLARKYGTSGKGNSSPTGRMSICFDCLNEFPHDVQFGPMDRSERDLARIHIENVTELLPANNCLFIFDRGYPCYSLIQFMLDKKTNFLMRTRRDLFNKVDEITDPIEDEIVDKRITLIDPKFPDVNLAVRVLKFRLSSGEIEILITNLFDLDKEEFKVLYFYRWEIEIANDLIKNKLEMANFTGRTETTIMQDLWCAILKDIIVSAYKHYVDLVIKAEAQDKKSNSSDESTIPVDDQEKEYKLTVISKNKHDYQARMTVIIPEALGMAQKLIFRPDIYTFEKLLNYSVLWVKRNKVPISDGTRSPKRRAPRRTKFHHNRKSCAA